MSLPVSLVDMPELPLKHIISFVGFRSLLSLRLVSKPLRHFIDTEKPPVQIDDLSIKIKKLIDPTRCSVELKLKSCGQSSVRHSVLKFGTREFESNSRRGYYSKTDYLHDSIHLLKYVFNTQAKHTIRKLEYSSEIPVNSEFLEMFQKFLTDQEITLKVREFSFEGHENQAVQFLPFFDSKILESLIFRWAPGNNLNDDLMQLEQWKQAKFLFSTEKVFRVPIQNFVHFETVEFNMHEITAEDLVYLKKNYSQSPHSTKATIQYQGTDSPFEVLGEPLETNSFYFKHATIHVTRYINTASMVSVLGEPFKINGKDREWYFKCSDRESALHLYLTKKLVKFVRCPVTAVPKGYRMKG